MSQVRRGDQPRYPHLLWPLRWTIAHSKRMVPLLTKKRLVAGSSATPHTHAPLRGARFLFSPAGRTTFSGGENHAPQNRAKTPTENKRSKGTQKKQKGPRLGLRGQNPKQETRTTGSQVSGLRGQQPQPAQKRPRPCRRKGPRRQRGRRGAGHP